MVSGCFGIEKRKDLVGGIASTLLNLERGRHFANTTDLGAKGAAHDRLDFAEEVQDPCLPDVIVAEEHGADGVDESHATARERSCDRPSNWPVHVL